MLATAVDSPDHGVGCAVRCVRGVARGSSRLDPAVFEVKVVHIPLALPSTPSAASVGQLWTFGLARTFACAPTAPPAARRRPPGRPLDPAARLRTTGDREPLAPARFDAHRNGPGRTA